MAGSPTLLPESRLGSTLRRDAWWVEIIPILVLMGGFSIYATLRAFEGKFYEWGPYLSPFYSPLIDPQHHWWPLSPALLILAGPLGFRATCYYYRKSLTGLSARSALLAPSVNLRTANTGGRHLFPSSSKIFIAIFSTSQSCSSSFCGTMPSDLLSLTATSASASALWCWPSTSPCSRFTRSLATRSAISPEANLTAFHARHSAAPVTRPGAGSVFSMSGTCSSPGAAWSPSALPISTCAWWPPAPSMT